MEVKKMLESYQSNRAEIAELMEKLNNLDQDSIGCSTILDYRTGYPRPQAVIGVDWEGNRAKRKRYERRIKKLNKECQETESFVEGIEDSLTRRILRMIYIDGMSLTQAGRAVKLDKSNVSRRIKKICEEKMKIATHATNATL